MTKFQFSLQKALDWRRKQLELEEVRFKQQAAELAELDRVRDETVAAGAQAETQVREWQSVAGSDLMALDRFRLRVRGQEMRLAAQRVEVAAKVAERQEAMLQARRSCKLLEKLRERRQEEWQAASDKELNELANDSFLAQWNRRAESQE